MGEEAVFFMSTNGMRCQYVQYVHFAYLVSFICEVGPKHLDHSIAWVNIFVFNSLQLKCILVTTQTGISKNCCLRSSIVQ